MRRRAVRHRTRGQSLVEFSLAITLFLFLLIGAIDLGRAVYQLNAVSQAAREIARTTSVHPGGAVLGSSVETVATVSSQRNLVPGMSVDAYSCLDIAGAAVAGACKPGHWVRVSLTSRFDPVLPFLMALGPINITSASSAEIE